MDPATIIQKWFNHHLRKSKLTTRQISNLTDDLEDCENYAYFFDALAPGLLDVKKLLAEPAWEKRAQYVLRGVTKLGCKVYITPRDMSEVCTLSAYDIHACTHTNNTCLHFLYYQFLLLYYIKYVWYYAMNTYAFVVPYL